ncbi:MAG TPA: C4-type zinc ribbon domain-containing protein [Ignavibacteria bacterium]|nr:C4-type zinc ribbon domain-containing protein [Ignavibacteria bacterium]
MQENQNEDRNEERFNDPTAGDVETRVVEYSMQETIQPIQQIQDKLLVFYELAKVDSELTEIEEEKGDLPHTIKTQEANIKSYEAFISENEKIIDKLDTEEQTLTKENEASEAIINKYDEQKYSVKSNKEYDDIVKAIDTNFVIVEKNEKRIKEILSEIEALSTKVDDYKKRLEEESKELEENRSKLDELNQQYEDEEKELNQKREKLIKQLDEDKKNQYNRINKSYKGEAIAVVRKENCSGCFNSIPPQRVIEIRSAQRIFTCQSCGRILIDETLLNSEPGTE